MSVRAPRLLALLLIVRRSLRQHALSTSVTIISAALASGLVMAVFALQTQSAAAFAGGASGFDAVLGARGSSLQLVLNAVFHVDASPGNLPWSRYEAMRDDPRVTLAVPLALGDNYRGIRIAGTTPAMFTSGGSARLASGRFFEQDALHEAVLGHLAARRSGLRVGSAFHPSHGLSGGADHDEAYHVVGVLSPTGGPIDRVIWVPIESVFHMEGHVLRGAGEVYEPAPDEEIPSEHKEVSAVLLRLRGPQAGFSLDEEINRGSTSATFAWPVSRVVADLFERLGWAARILELVAFLVVAVAVFAILASIYNAIRERRRDIAILRALGARRRLIFSAVVVESSTIAFLGALGGYAVYVVILAVAGAIVRAQTGVVLDGLHFHPVLVVMPPSMLVLGAVAGIVPAIRAYATDVVEGLHPVS